MGHHREDVVARALAVLDDYGLADLTMRRLAHDLGVQPSALYHHFRDKQTLLAAVADELLRRGPLAATAATMAAVAVGARDGVWDEEVSRVCTALRDSVLAYRDGAELVATVRAFGLGAHAPYDAVAAALRGGGLDEGLVRVAADTLLHFVLGHAVDEQTHLQAGSAGAIPDEPRRVSDFDLGLAIVVDGIRVHAAAGRSAQGSTSAP